jgi:hypothetical protein
MPSTVAPPLIGDLSKHVHQTGTVEIGPNAPAAACLTRSNVLRASRRAIT